jgi:hypothetical protein
MIHFSAKIFGSIPAKNTLNAAIGVGKTVLPITFR